MLFHVGQLYSRATDIHDKFGGSRQSGISPSAEHPLIFLFAGESGDHYGYADGWSEGVFHYSGEGQRGNMEFVRGNKAVRDHAVDGKDLHLFTALGKGKPYRYEGSFVCSGWHEAEGHDVEGKFRRTIVFHLVGLEDLADVPEGEDEIGGPAKSLSELRALAVASANATGAEAPGEGRRNIYERSAAVRDYVLARATGRCECCRQDAPFRRRDGTPYLEPHHIRRLSDGGPDHPCSVAAICPNCHRNIHHGEAGPKLNEELAKKISELERQKVREAR